MLKFSNRFI